MKLERLLFEVVIVLALGLLSYIGLAAYEMRVIEKQRVLIKQLYQDHSCTGLRGES